MLMSSHDYRESLRRQHPRVYLNGRAVESVPDEPLLAPGVNALGVSYDFALREELAHLMRARAGGPRGHEINRMMAIPETADDLLHKLEAVRLLCQETGCAQRYLGGDALAALRQATHRVDAEEGTEYAPRLEVQLERIWGLDLALGVAMTDGKGDRRLRPHAQPSPESYLRIVERRGDGVVLSGVKAIITGGPYVHELVVLPCRNLLEADADYAVAALVPLDAEGLTLVARPAGRPGEAAALFSRRRGQSTAVALFDRVFVPWERVFLAGEWQHAGWLTRQYATQHRHTCIAARAGFGDLLIGAGALVTEANGIDLDQAPNLRERMVELIKIVEGFYACGVAASVYAHADPSGVAVPDEVFANVGKLLLSTQIYDMQRLAHHLSGGLVVSLPGPEEDHNPVTAGRLSELLAGRSDVPYAKRIEVARLIEDLTASYQGGWYSVISLHGGGSPEAMALEIWRRYPLGDKVDLVERLLERDVVAAPGRKITRNRQPGRCCAAGCQAARADEASERSVGSIARSHRRDEPEGSGS